MPADGLDDAGFVGPAPRAVNVTVPVGVGPIVVNANVTSHVAVYADANSDVFANETAARGRDAATPANATPTTLVVLSTPAFRTLGVTLNPLARRPDPAMVERVPRLLDEVPGAPAANLSGEVGVTDRHERTVLGRQTAVTTYAGSRTGATRVVLVTVEHEGDVVVFVGTHDGGAAADRLVDLMTRAEHPADLAGNLPTNESRPPTQ